MCPEAYDPNWKPPEEEKYIGEQASLQALNAEPSLIESSVAPPPEKKLGPTDFKSIKGDIGKVKRRQVLSAR